MQDVLYLRLLEQCQELLGSGGIMTVLLQLGYEVALANNVPVAQGNVPLSLR